MASEERIRQDLLEFCKHYGINHSLEQTSTPVRQTMRSSQLCDRCKVLQDVWQPVKNSYWRQPKDQSLGVRTVVSEFVDAWPNLPKLVASVAEGCEVCKVLLDCTDAVDQAVVDHYEGDATVRWQSFVEMTGRISGYFVEIWTRQNGDDDKGPWTTLCQVKFDVYADERTLSRVSSNLALQHTH
jgi:hypothetical protein